MNSNQLYDVNGYYSNDIMSQSSYKAPKNILDDDNHPTMLNNYSFHNFLGPYQNPMLNYGVGPQAANITQEILTADKNDLEKSPVLREPTKDNPMMNVMPLDYGMKPLFEGHQEYTNNSKRSQKTREEMKKDFEKGLYQNADSLLWNRVNSQRQYYSAPVDTVPNNQDEFGQWLYGNNYVCKQGSVYARYGVKYTDDSLLCNGFNSATPSNKGLLNGQLMSSVEKS